MNKERRNKRAQLRGHRRLPGIIITKTKKKEELPVKKGDQQDRERAI